MRRAGYWSQGKRLRIALEPRPFDELEEERHCLLDALNHENEKLLNQYRHLADIEESIKGVRTEGGLRQAKDQRQWYGKKVAENLEEEQMILYSLSEIHLEIQARDRWYIVHNERSRTSSLGPPGAMPPSQRDDATTLSSRRHHPQELRNIRVLASPPPGQTRQGRLHHHGDIAHIQQHHQTINTYVRDILKSGSKCGNAGHADNNSSSKSAESADDYQPPEGNSNPDVKRIRRRASLPSLQFAWSSMSEDSHKCLGYAEM